MTPILIPFRQAEWLHGTRTVCTVALLLPHLQSGTGSPGLCFSCFKHGARNSSDKCHTSIPPSTSSLGTVLPCSLVIQPLIQAASEHGILYPWLLPWVLASSLQDSTTTSCLGTDSTKLGWWFSPGCHDVALELLGHGSFNQDLGITS